MISRSRSSPIAGSTRLVNRLEERALLQRVLCADDRRGVYTELTTAGQRLLERARPVHDRTLEAALERAEETPELAALARALHEVTRA